MGLPDGWNNYDRVGKQVFGTRFIAFKVPLKEAINIGSQVPEEKQLYPKLLVSMVPKLGLIIDLTNTFKYYDPNEFQRLGVQYQKIKVEGHVIPRNGCSVKFRDVVNAFLDENQNNDKLIGVHCTHGLNRSGFLVCRYMIEEMNIAPLEAIAAFEIGRGHKMERQNYIDKLKCLTVGGGNSTRIPKLEVLPSLAIDTEFDKGCQTNRGFYINESILPEHHRKVANSSNDSGLDAGSRSISLNLQKRHMIPDGKGGYFIHLTKKEIQRREKQQNDSRRSNEQRDDNQRHIGNRPYRPQMAPLKRTSNQSNQPYMRRPRFMSQQMPLGANNLSENLIQMSHHSNIHPNEHPNQYPHEHYPY